MSEKMMVQIIPPNHKLKAKAAGPNSMTKEQALGRAEAVVKSRAAEFHQVSIASIAMLADFWHATAKKPGDFEEKDVRTLAKMAHDLKGQGATFGYPLVTDVAASLFKLLDRPPLKHPAFKEVIEVHVSTLQVIIAHNMRGDGGGAGQALLKGVSAAAEKVINATPSLKGILGGEQPDDDDDDDDGFDRFA
jgi:hypothetical protein